MTDASHQSPSPGSGICAILLGVVGQTVFVTMPFFLALVKQGRGFSDSQISLVSSSDMLGMFLASLLATTWVTRRRWRVAAALSIGLLLAATVISLTATAFLPFAAARVLCGLGAGSLTAIGMSAMSEREKPDAWFGWYLATLSLAGVATSFAIPRFLQPYGLTGYLIALLVLYTLLFFVLGTIPARSRKNGTKQAAGSTVQARLLPVLSLLAIFFFGASIFATWSHLQLIATARGLSAATGGDAISLAYLLGIPLSIGAGLLPGRVHRVPLFAVLAVVHLGGLCIMLFADPATAMPFQLAIVLLGTGWSFASPLQVGLTASLDTGGRFVVLFVAAMKVSYVFAGAALSLLSGAKNDIGGNVLLFSIATGSVSLALYLYLAWRSPGTPIGVAVVGRRHNPQDRRITK